MESSELLCLSEDFELYPEVIEVSLDEAFILDVSYDGS